MPRRLLKDETKRSILTCFETFIEANDKQLTKRTSPIKLLKFFVHKFIQIHCSVNSICAILLYILASVVV
jgi:hypothetical protein